MEIKPIKPVAVVVACLVRDEWDLVNGRNVSKVLLQKRKNTRDFGGFWEFPGGKVEQGETDQQALARELNEELGITKVVFRQTPLVFIHLDSPSLKVPCDLTFYKVESWEGNPQPLDADELYWHTLDFKTDPSCSPLTPGSIAALPTLLGHVRTGYEPICSGSLVHLEYDYCPVHNK